MCVRIVCCAQDVHGTTLVLTPHEVLTIGKCPILMNKIDACKLQAQGNCRNPSKKQLFELFIELFFFKKRLNDSFGFLCHMQEGKLVHAHPHVQLPKHHANFSPNITKPFVDIGHSASTSAYLLMLHWGPPFAMRAPKSAGAVSLPSPWVK